MSISTKSICAYALLLAFSYLLPLSADDPRTLYRGNVDNSPQVQRNYYGGYSGYGGYTSSPYYSQNYYSQPVYPIAPGFGYYYGYPAPTPNQAFPDQAQSNDLYRYLQER